MDMAEEEMSKSMDGILSSLVSSYCGQGMDIRLMFWPVVIWEKKKFFFIKWKLRLKFWTFPKLRGFPWPAFWFCPQSTPTSSTWSSPDTPAKGITFNGSGDSGERKYKLYPWETDKKFWLVNMDKFNHLEAWGVFN